jgi:phosphoribosylglycinamide formyltransferase-1
VPRQDRDTNEAHERALDAALSRLKAELICLAGYMRVLSPGFVQKWQGRLINIHPALLPAFPGLDTHRRALEAGLRVHGATVHFVTAAIDDGPIIAQAAVPVLAGDTAERLEARILRQEHRLYPLIVRWFAEDRIALVEGRVTIKGVRPDAALLFSPAP